MSCQSLQVLTTRGKSKRSESAASDRPIMRDRTVKNGQGVRARACLLVCLFVCCDAVKSSRQRRQPGGGIDVLLSVYAVIIIIIIIIIIK